MRKLRKIFATAKPYDPFKKIGSGPHAGKYLYIPKWMLHKSFVEENGKYVLKSPLQIMGIETG